MANFFNGDITIKERNKRSRRKGKIVIQAKFVQIDKGKSNTKESGIITEKILLGVTRDNK